MITREETIDLCMDGHCGTLATLIAARTGWPTAGVFVDHTEPGGPQHKRGIHACVVTPDGRCLDALGAHAHPDSWADVYAIQRGLDIGAIVTFELCDEVESVTNYGDTPWLEIASLAFDLIASVSCEHVEVNA